MANIYVGNLSHDATEEQLKELFTPYGQVDRVAIITDRQTGQSRGFGFVEMPDSSAAQAAIEGLNGTELGGRALIVNVARGKSERRGGGGGGWGRSRPLRRLIGLRPNGPGRAVCARTDGSGRVGQPEPANIRPLRGTAQRPRCRLRLPEEAGIAVCRAAHSAAKRTHLVFTFFPVGTVQVSAFLPRPIRCVCSLRFPPSSQPKVTSRAEVFGRS